MNRISTILLLLVLVVGFGVGPVAGQSTTVETIPPGLPKASETDQLPEGLELLQVDGFPTKTSPSVPMPASMLNFLEVEPNNTLAQANLLPGTGHKITGNIYPVGDVDTFSFQANAGDRVYAAVQTQFSPASLDSELTVLDSVGTVLEYDDNDGSFATTSSSIAGTVIPASGTYFLKVNQFGATSTIRPYYLYFRLQAGSPAGETEPNDTSDTATAAPVNGWIAGNFATNIDADFYSLDLNAGDTVFLSLDLDPERDDITSNGRLGIGLFSGYVLLINDTTTATPNSEAFFLTVKNSGTYYVLVDAPSSPVVDDYQLSISVLAAPVSATTCTTYTNSAITPLADLSTTTSQIFVPEPAGRVGDLDITINLSHANMQDLDVVLIAPDGNQVALFTDVGSSSLPAMDLTLNDEAGFPVNLFTILSGTQVQPELNSRLAWFDGQKAAGTWTLQIADDTSAMVGTLNSWSLRICQQPEPPACSPGFTPITIFSTDFETNLSGFTSAGTVNEWEYGTPTLDPISSCSSGTNCWKTDLDGGYDASTSQDLLSPIIQIPVLASQINLSWAQKYQMESATFDHAWVEIYEAGDGLAATRLWEWLDGSMSTQIGLVTIQEAAGWGSYHRDIQNYAGKSIQVKFHLDSDSSVSYSGLAVDDFKITGCIATVYLPVVIK